MIDGCIASVITAKAIRFKASAYATTLSSPEVPCNLAKTTTILFGICVWRHQSSVRDGPRSMLVQNAYYRSTHCQFLLLSCASEASEKERDHGCGEASTDEAINECLHAAESYTVFQYIAYLSCRQGKLTKLLLDRCQDDHIYAPFYGY